MLFDSKTQARFYRLWEKARLHGSRLTPESSTPHITLAVFDKIPENVLQRRLNSLAKKQRAFLLRFSTIGLFPTTKDVVFLSPVPSQELIKIHRECHTLFQDFHRNGNLHKYFTPFLWNPHVTVATGLSASSLSPAIEAIKKEFVPFDASVEYLSFLQFSRGKAAKHHAKISLKKI